MAGDYADEAKATEDLFMDLALRQQKAKSRELEKALGKAGVCLNCGESEFLPTPEARYCDADCQRDHESRLASRKRSGKV